MSNVFFTADLHFGHDKIIQYQPNERPFASIEEHDKAIIERINSRVGRNDILWILGDLTIKLKLPELYSRLSRINGRKLLVLGNHDTFCVNDYLVDFEGVYATAEKYKFIMSHIPMHPDSLQRWGFNVHGHLHAERVMRDESTIGTDELGYDEVQTRRVIDPRYFCVSLEQNNCYPFSLNEILEYRKVHNV